MLGGFPKFEQRQYLSKAIVRCKRVAEHERGKIYQR